ncbi:hypothetical protein JKP88DRAFT_178230 [Tribonema minus]|uniref:AMP-dependent synthetase/ligase domain-containing protein n=1 Tax=Tribonema minus TaxID=303371 RepID=A0A835Z5R5_9STRA|nr:hypothetical protein JKP88DRAFT_178230 [Tribonema minus]
MPTPVVAPQRTILHELKQQAALQPTKPLYIWHAADGSVTEQYTYSTFDRLTDEMALRIYQTWGSPAKTPSSGRHFAVLVYPPGLEFMVAFVACLKANVVAVPVCPIDPRRIGTDAHRLYGIVKAS